MGKNQEYKLYVCSAVHILLLTYAEEGIHFNALLTRDV